MTIGRSIHRYGRIEVGQRVKFQRLVGAPTPKESRYQFGRSGHVVTVTTEHIVEDMRICDSGALVTLRHADGEGQLLACFDGYGQCRGGFGGLDVLVDAPYQRNLPGVRA